MGVLRGMWGVLRDMCGGVEMCVEVWCAAERTVLKPQGKLESGTLTLCFGTQEPGSLYSRPDGGPVPTK